MRPCRTKTVSYTHLDVYKRQVPESVGSAGNSCVCLYIADETACSGGRGRRNPSCRTVFLYRKKHKFVQNLRKIWQQDREKDSEIYRRVSCLWKKIEEWSLMEISWSLSLCSQFMECFMEKMCIRDSFELMFSCYLFNYTWNLVWGKGILKSFAKTIYK